MDFVEAFKDTGLADGITILNRQPVKGDRGLQKDFVIKVEFPMNAWRNRSNQNQTWASAIVRNRLPVALESLFVFKVYKSIILLLENSPAAQAHCLQLAIDWNEKDFGSAILRCWILAGDQSFANGLKYLYPTETGIDETIKFGRLALAARRWEMDVAADALFEAGAKKIENEEMLKAWATNFADVFMLANRKRPGNVDIFVWAERQRKQDWNAIAEQEKRERVIAEEIEKRVRAQLNRMNVDD
jgi:hypothetical protein